MDFKELNILPAILRALTDEKYSSPTPIQEQAIPAVLEGKDLLGCAQTGTGKTAAFAIPTLQLLAQRNTEQTKAKRDIRALILTPTRELAVQINDSFSAYGRYLKLRSCVVFGGVSQGPQVAKLQRGVDILIATPGRLGDLMNQGYINISKVEILILDEADRMLDMGFITDVKRIVARTPENKQTLLFSATMPQEISSMANSLLKDPVKIAVTPVSSAVDVIKQSVYFVDKGNKIHLLLDILKDKNVTSALVFTRTKHGADRVVNDLLKNKVNAAAIHGDKSQNARQLALNKFKNHETRVLVATDIAARGIDIDELSHVVNYDLPEVPETYVHRIGRTGRAGLSGTAISFCAHDEKPLLRGIEKLVGRKIDEISEHDFPLVITILPPKSAGQRRRSESGFSERSRPSSPRSSGRSYDNSSRQRSEGSFSDNRKRSARPDGEGTSAAPKSKDWRQNPKSSSRSGTVQYPFKSREESIQSAKAEGKKRTSKNSQFVYDESGIPKVRSANPRGGSSKNKPFYSADKRKSRAGDSGGRPSTHKKDSRS